MLHPNLLPRFLRAFAVLAIITALAPTQPAHAASVIYVVPGGAGSQTGGDWANAKDLQAALHIATIGDQIWVKAGTYNPTTANDRTATFQLKSGVALYGGFAGDETALSQRDPAANISILSGDLLGNDSGTVTSGNPTRSDNSYHVVTGSGTDDTAVLDGFTITSGHASSTSMLGFGGGLFVQNGTPTVRHSMISENFASMGGGMSNFNAAPIVSDVVFSGNSADSGGGVGNTQSNPTLSKVTFINNKATNNGGGMANFYDSHPALSQSVFSGNSTAQAGGGMANEYNSSPTIRETVFSHNTAYFGAGMFNYDRSSPTLDLSTFSENAAADTGGGMYTTGNSHPIINRTTFSANTAIYGGGMANGSDVSIVSTTFLSNTAALVGGGVMNESSKSIIIQSIFNANSAGTYGSGIANYRSNATISHVTFSGNWSKNNGGALANQESSPLIHNSIFWGNYGGQIYNYLTNNTPDVQYTLVQGGYLSGTHLLDADPLFVDADGADNIAGTPDDNLRLQAGSPAIDAGSNAFIPSDLTDDNDNNDVNETAPFDLDRNPRLDGAIVDLGPYETQLHTHITSALPPAGTYGSGYGHTFTASALAPVTYSITAGTLPPGLALNSTTGLLSGTPTATGSYSGITVTASNADGSANQTFTLVIQPKALTVTAESKSKTYGAANPMPTVSYSGFVLGDDATVLSGSPSCASTATTSGVGVYPIHCTIGTLTATNYTFTFVDGTLSISPAPLTIAADNKTRAFGAPNPLLTASYSGFVNDDAPASLDVPVSLTTTATIASSPGSYPITASGAADADYDVILVPATLTITGSRTYLALIGR